MLLMLGLLVAVPFKAHAAEEVITAKTLMEISEAAEVYAESGGQGDVLVTLEAGTPVISAEDIDMSGTGEEWCQITYQDYTGYIQVKQLKQFIADDVEEQLDSVANNNQMVFEEIEYIKKQDNQKLIWGIVIAALIIAIFAVGIASAVLKNKKEGMKE